jgi:iron complex outermembrane receptor protein
MGTAGQFQFSDTRFRIFIPDFSMGQVAAYAVKTLYRGKQVWEGGVRSETRWLQVFPSAGSGGRRLFFSFMANGGFRREIHEHWSLSANAMAAMRPPHVSELYSSGVHHGSASYEQGDASLKPETIVNLSSSLQHKSAHWELMVNGYLTHSPRFIYLTPVGDSVLLTIRGAFPFFQYRQEAVTLRGADFFIRFEPFPFLGVEVRAQALRGWNHSERDFLIFQPADRVSACIRFQKNLKSRGIAFDFRFGPVQVARQTRFPADRDFIPPPAGFTLWEGRASVSRRRGAFPFDLSVEVRNLFNLRYREYLNRFRYFAPEAGRNLMIRLSIPIHS